jgi:RNA polymerase sigma-70 factor (ECF subfamily)
MPKQWGRPSEKLQAVFRNLESPSRHYYDEMVTGPALKTVGDLALVDRCVSGDRSAQRELFQQQKRRVHATLFRVLGANAEMEDLIQESFIEVFKSLRSYRGEAQLATWIDRIAVRVAFAWLTRRRSRAVRLEAVPEIPAGDASAEQRAALRQAARRMY